MKAVLKRSVSAAMALCLALTAFSGCKSTRSIESDLAVSFSKESGTYSEEFSLELESDIEGTIYYTTDGSDPSVSDTAKEYSGAIKITDRKSDKNMIAAVEPALFDAAHDSPEKGRESFSNSMKAPDDSAVDKCTVIRASVKDKSGSFSKAATATYFINDMSDHVKGIKESCEASGQDLAVISISANYEDFFSPETGIYVKGDKYDDALAKYLEEEGKVKDTETSRGLDANYKQKGREWERPVHIDFFESDGEDTTLAISQDCGIRVQGNYSRSDLQKGLRLYAREEYGIKNFYYPVFGDDAKDSNGKTVEKFKTLNLRAGGNTAFIAKYNDAYWQSLVTELDMATQASRPCVVYLNGEYMGLYILQENYSDNFFSNKYDVQDTDVVLYKGDAEQYASGYKLDIGEVPDGASNEGCYLSDLNNFFKNHEDLSDQSDLKEFEKLVDTESVLDYFAVEIWLNNKWDWPGKNWSMWKTVTKNSSNKYNDGRWRMCLYDLDFAGVSGEEDAYANTVAEDNYKPDGLLDFNTNNPAVLCYAYLMTNKSSRESFEQKLNKLTEQNFEKASANEALDRFNDTYSPLFDQFFERYPESGSKDNSINGGYGSYRCIKDFLEYRADNIDTMINFIESIRG